MTCRRPSSDLPDQLARAEDSARHMTTGGRGSEKPMNYYSQLRRSFSLFPARLRAPIAWPNDLPPRSCRVCNTHHTCRGRVTSCATQSLASCFETLPAETYMYLLGLSLKSLAYLACLSCVPFRHHSCWGSFPIIGCSSKEAACCVALATKIPWWVCTTSLFACVVHECVRITACVRLASLASFEADCRRPIFCGHAINCSTSKQHT
jgi:hypothetical protein